MTAIILSPEITALAVRGVVWAVPGSLVDYTTANGNPLPLSTLVGERVQIQADDTEPRDFSSSLVMNHGHVPLARGQVVGSAICTAVVPIVSGDEYEPYPWVFYDDFDADELVYGPVEGDNVRLEGLAGLFPEGSWDPGGQECEACEGSGFGFRYLGEGDHEEFECTDCDGSGRTPQRFALILSEAEVNE